MDGATVTDGAQAGTHFDSDALCSSRNQMRKCKRVGNFPARPRKISFGCLHKTVVVSFKKQLRYFARQLINFVSIASHCMRRLRRDVVPQSSLSLTVGGQVREIQSVCFLRSSEAKLAFMLGTTDVAMWRGKCSEG